MTERGCFIVLEGLDRSGKSTQLTRLVDNLNKAGKKAKACRFPDRTTTIGKMIDAYLAQKAELDDRAIHLLFSANRWERAQAILTDINDGVTVVCDRYAFSGIAFSAVKGLDYEWCKAPDRGLPLPDLTLFLSVSPEAAAARGGFGAERYETSEVQTAVREMFARIGRDVGEERWQVVDASLSVDEVEESISARTRQLTAMPLSEVGQLWVEADGPM